MADGRARGVERGVKMCFGFWAGGEQMGGWRALAEFNNGKRFPPESPPHQTQETRPRPPRAAPPPPPPPPTGRRGGECSSSGSIYEAAAFLAARAAARRPVPQVVRTLRLRSFHCFRVRVFFVARDLRMRRYLGSNFFSEASSS
jgi:hypothetical protein